MSKKEKKATLKEVEKKPEPQRSHFLVTRELLQAVFNYLNTRPAQEVLNMINALQQTATAVDVKVPEQVAAQAEQAAAPAPVAEMPKAAEKKSASKSKKAAS